MTPKQEMICRQLVLRAVVWDAEDLDKNERKKLEEEIQAFRIRRIQVKGAKMQRSSRTAYITGSKRRCVKRGFLKKQRCL